MNYRKLGKTGLMVSEIGLGGEWLERHNTEECKSSISVRRKESIYWTVGCRSRMSDLILVPESRVNASVGLFRDILAQPGRMDSM